MSRCRTHRTTNYYSISNATCQDHSISFEALGLLAHCLSMPSDWIFNPKTIWKQRDCSRDKVYKRFNELISKFHCIRIQLPNPKARHLPGEVEYEFYDDVDMCKKRIKELESSENFITHGDNFKKCFRHPEYQDPKGWDPKGWDPNSQEETNNTNKTKDTSYTKETTTTTPTPSEEVVVVNNLENVEVSRKMEAYLDEFSIGRGESWKIRMNDLYDLMQKCGCRFVSDQLNYMLKQQQQAEKDENNPHKPRKAKPIDKPLTFLNIACEKNWAKSKQKKERICEK